MTKILYVDDTKKIRREIADKIRKYGFEVMEAGNGKDALECYKEDMPDIVFMDMLMPVLDGYDATRKIREWERETGRSAVPIIALTAQARKEDLNKTLEVGCSSCLTKPVKKDTLLQTIASH